MKKLTVILGSAILIGLSCTAVLAAPEINKPAPDFTATDSNGQTVHLSDFKGKEVVMEWSNSSCPYVRKWYGSGAMQALQTEAAQKGVVWLTVISSAPGQEGFVSPAKANEDTQSRHAAPTRVLIDPQGTLGHLYDAKTTPDIYVIGPDGALDYMGGADSIASTDPDDIKKAEPYAREAIVAVADGKPVQHPVTRPYGCNVKYGE